MQVLCLELTKEINELEEKKNDSITQAPEILELEKHISKRYLFLANVLQSYPDLKRECILTVFSLNPSRENFELIRSLYETQPDKEGNRDSSSIVSTKIASSHCRSDNSTNLHIILPEAIRCDLTCLLSVPRIKNLNCSSPWPELKKACEELLQAEKKKQMVENCTAKAKDKLKYISLNYDEFKNFKPYEYPGIEKGYEIYIADSSSGESCVVAEDSDDTDTAPESKSYIVEEARRIRNRKRVLIRRSQKMLAQSEQSSQVQQSGKMKSTTRNVGDGLKPKRRKVERKISMTPRSAKPSQINNGKGHDCLNTTEQKNLPNENDMEIQAIGDSQIEVHTIKQEIEMSIVKQEVPEHENRSNGADLQSDIPESSLLETNVIKQEPETELASLENEIPTDTNRCELQHSFLEIQYPSNDDFGSIVTKSSLVESLEPKADDTFSCTLESVDEKHESDLTLKLETKVAIDLFGHQSNTDECGSTEVQAHIPMQLKPKSPLKLFRRPKKQIPGIIQQPNEAQNDIANSTLACPSRSDSTTESFDHLNGSPNVRYQMANQIQFQTDI